MKTMLDARAFALPREICGSCVFLIAALATAIPCQALLNLKTPLTAESICPGGSSPRSDIVWCSGFDDTANCLTGREAQCWQDNAWSNTPPFIPVEPSGFMRILQDPSGAAVGNGYVKGVPKWGSTGPGYIVQEMPVPGGVKSASLRWYEKIDHAYNAFGSHGPGLAMAGWKAHGTVNGSLNGAASRFTDPTKDFVAAGVVVGKQFADITDGSYANVASITTTVNPNDTLVFTAPLSQGVKNQFTNGDEYGVVYCGSSTQFEPARNSYNILLEASCSIPNGVWQPNQPVVPYIQEGKWYLFEERLTMDTSCTDTTKAGAASGCNGQVQLYIDGVKVIDYQNVNLGGVGVAARITAIWGPREYHHRVTPWGGEIGFDNFAFSKTGDYIGPAANQNILGAPDPYSPYFFRTIGGINPLIGDAVSDTKGYKWAGDCSASSSLYGAQGYQWRNAGILQTAIKSPSVTTIDSACSAQIPALVDKALQISLTTTTADGAGGGVQWDLFKGLKETSGAYGITGPSMVFPQHALYGRMFLPASNDYASPGLALAGYAWYWGKSWGNYVAIGISNGKWAVVEKQKNDPSTIVAHQTSAPALYDQWVEFELTLWEDDKYSLMINKNRLADRAPLSYSVRNSVYLGWPDTGNGASAIMGVLDFKGTVPFNAYFDDIGYGTASMWSCDGWNPSKCPFSAPGTQLGGPHPYSSLLPPDNKPPARVKSVRFMP